MPAPSPAVRVLSALPGRIRYAVEGVRQEPEYAAALEHHLGHVRGVESAVANPVTGRVLVLFRPGEQSDAGLREVLRHFQARPDVHLAHAREHARGDAHAHGDGRPHRLELADTRTVGGGVPGHEHTHDDPYHLSREESDAVERGHVLRLVLGGVVLGVVLGVVAAKKLLMRERAPVGRGVLGGVASLTTLLTGYPFIRGGLRSLGRPGHIDTDTLVTVATLASLMMRENVPALIVVWLLNLGEYLRFKTLRRSRAAIEQLLSLGEEEVHVLEDGREVKRPLGEVRVGWTVAFYTGQKVAVDGEVLSGQATLNQAPITGESIPVMKGPGDPVYAGTLVLAGSLVVRTTRVGDETAMGRLIHRVEEARELQAPIQLLGERFSSRFVPVSFAMSLLVLLLTRDYRRALTMLVVACPCAAGLATPTAVSATIGNAARRGILIKGGAYLEEAGSVDTVVFDKTGTLTVGMPQVTRVVSVSPEHAPLDVVSIAASGELHSQHPIALAVLRYTSEREMRVPEHERCEVVVGRGMRADLQGNQVLVGSWKLLAESGVQVPDTLMEEVRRFQEGGDTAICVAVNGKAIGVVGVADALRPEALEALGALATLGVKHLLMLTGDSAESGASVGRMLGIRDVRAELLPEDKFTTVRQQREEGARVAMVGDGINDAPALALAHVGVAMGTAGSDVAVEAADIALASNDLRAVPEVLHYGRRTLRVIRQNYVASLVVNAGGVLVGALGALNPVLAAILHNLSTQLVVLNSSRLLTLEPLVLPTPEGGGEQRWRSLPRTPP